MLEKILPSEERRKKGPYAVFECFQRIPCNPCSTSCKTGAVKTFSDINDLPEVDYDKCTGCGLCISACPGLAIFVVDETYSATEALIKIPYEHYPMTEEGAEVQTLNRDGAVVSRGVVTRVQHPKNKTLVVWLKVPKEDAHVVRGIKSASGKKEFTAPVEIQKQIGPSFICRCEDIPLENVQELISKGVILPNEIKRETRNSMGPCQGKTCIPLVLQEIAKSTGISTDELLPPTNRQPIKPIKLGLLAGGE
ncbi:MAG: 4Fe-4S binding protein [Dehalobacterium sp.]